MCQQVYITDIKSVNLVIVYDYIYVYIIYHIKSTILYINICAFVIMRV